MTTRSRPFGGAAILLSTAFLAACASAKPAPSETGILAELEPGGYVLTQSQIQEMDVFNAMDVLIRSRSHLKIDRLRANAPMRITHRGVNTLTLSPEILLVVDGARAAHPDQLLRSIPARSILFIQILSGREASSRFGSLAGNGVIVVRTSAL